MLSIKIPTYILCIQIDKLVYRFLPIAVGDGLAIEAVSVSVVIIGELRSPLSLPSSPSFKKRFAHVKCYTKPSM